MKRDQFFFSHDSDAKDDHKIILLIEDLGLEGYGIFWVLIESLRQASSYILPIRLIPGIARRYNTQVDKIKNVLTKYELFEIDKNNNFYSKSLLNRMELYDKKVENARLAGQKSARQRMLNERSTDVQPMLNQCSTSKVKESKVKESKRKEKHVVLNPSGLSDADCAYAEKEIINPLMIKVNNFRTGYPKMKNNNAFKIIGLMVRCDERELEEIAALIAWYPIGQEFIPEIYSFKALREKYDKLYSASKRVKHQKDNTTEKIAEIENNRNKRETDEAAKLLLGEH